MPSHYSAWQGITAPPPGYNPEVIGSASDGHTRARPAQVFLEPGAGNGPPYQARYIAPSVPVHTERSGDNDQVMLDDRWASFMNFGVMGQGQRGGQDVQYKQP